MKHSVVSGLLFSCAAILLAIGSVAAFSASSTNYRIDDGVVNSLGGNASSTNYELTDSGGEPFIGMASSTNYQFNAGYVASLEHSLTLSLNALTITIPKVTAGSSQTATSSISVQTDAAGYILSAREDKDLTAVVGSATIPAISSSIASPSTWMEGTTKGLGFTLISGSSLEAKWGTSPNYAYAAFPTTSTAIHTKPLYQNATDVNIVQYRLDVSSTQAPGTYRNVVTYNATVRP